MEELEEADRGYGSYPMSKGQIEEQGVRGFA